MRVDSVHLIGVGQTILDALKQINVIESGPRVLFVLDENDRVAGSLTDGDIRRALISGAEMSTLLIRVMHGQFHFLRIGADDEVVEIRRLREKNLKMVPVLDISGRLVELLDLDHYVTRLPLDTVLMAGGKGIRLRPLTDNTPKPLLKVGGRPIIDLNVERLIRFGVKNISVTVNYLAEQLETHFAEPIQDVQVKCVREPKFLGTIGSLKFVEAFHNDTILIMNSDLFTNINFEDFFLHFKENKADMSVAAVPYTVSVPYGIIELEGQRVHGVVEKSTYTYFANAGIYLIKRSVLDLIPDGELFHATDLIEALSSKRRNVIRFPLNGTWIDIGNIQEYQKADELARHLI